MSSGSGSSTGTEPTIRDADREMIEMTALELAALDPAAARYIRHITDLGLIEALSTRGVDPVTTLVTIHVAVRDRLPRIAA